MEIVNIDVMEIITLHEFSVYFTHYSLSMRVSYSTVLVVSVSTGWSSQNVRRLRRRNELILPWLRACCTYRVTLNNKPQIAKPSF